MRVIISGHEVLVDDEDAALVERSGWRVKKTSDKGRPYVLRSQSRGARPHTLYLHRMIINPPEGLTVDHINGDTLDNRRVNLRLATMAQQRQNARRRMEGCSSRFKGVHARRDKWTARIKVDGRLTRLGSFSTEEEAAHAYDEAALAAWGPFAAVNQYDGEP